jgi:hypothetical protein
VQLEFPWALGPADGRYLVRDPGEAAPSHVLVLATLGAPERRRLRGRRASAAAPKPPPAPVTTTRATVIDATSVSTAEAERWLAASGETEAEQALAQIARAVHAHRLASADPGVRTPALAHALVVRAGYGAGEQVADGRWSAARELPRPSGGRRRRVAAIRPQERLAALLGGHADALACEELTLRAREDLDRGRLREAALQLRAALDAAIAELPREAGASADLARRVEELGTHRAELDGLVETALADAPAPDAAEALTRTLQRLEAALRARIAGQL